MIEIDFTTKSKIQSAKPNLYLNDGFVSIKTTIDELKLCESKNFQMLNTHEDYSKFDGLIKETK